jgi:ABC-2 type transport system ATP-binding protein
MSALATLYATQTIGLTKRFGRTLALDQLNLAVEPGDVFGFLGPNGAGKSTTIRLLLGHLEPTAGQAWIFGHPSGDATAAHRHLAYVPADVALWPAQTGAETLELLADIGSGRSPLPRRVGAAVRARGRAAVRHPLNGKPPEGSPGRGIRHRRAAVDPR